MRRNRDGRGFTALTVRGGILPPDFLLAVASLEAKHQTGPEYGLTKSLNIKDEIARYWRIANDLYAAYAERRNRANLDPKVVGVDGWLVPLFTGVLGYADLAPTAPVIIGERRFPVTHFALDSDVPFLLMTRDVDLDRADARFGDQGRRRAPHSLMQELLNADDVRVWGIVANGATMQLLRDNPTLTRPAYIEADLQQIFEEQLYADFAAVWLVAHATRLRPVAGKAANCILEIWRAQAHEAGERALEHLRDGVAEALRALGNGFLEHPDNEQLRSALASDSLRSESFFEELLGLVYRLLFLFATEERELLHDLNATAEKRAIYQEGYALARLRERALRRRHYDRHGDLWQGLQILFRALANGEPAVGLPALGGLLAPDHCPNLDRAAISNARLLETIRALAFFRSGSTLARVNYRDMGTEELGSVYESLLELHPHVNVDVAPWTFWFVGDESGEKTKGTARKFTSSYYTPAPLVNQLITSALEPVIAQAVAARPEDPRGALLQLKVVDPACGSGHFLLAAARRIAAEIARIEAGSDAPDETARQHALREVVQHCIYGVDRNPLAVELCKTALWIETVEPGKPLTFLDSHIRCGDALLGLLDLSVLDGGIPGAAYEAREGDSKDVAAALRRKNQQRVRDINTLPLFAAAAASVESVEILPEESLEQVRAKRTALVAAESEPSMVAMRLRADLFCAAFFARKTISTEPIVPLTSDIDKIAIGQSARPDTVAMARDLAKEHKFFHWPLMFADVFARGGFDVVLGNPPWKPMSPDAKEWFAPYDPEVRVLEPGAQEQRIAELLTAPGMKRAWDAYRQALYDGAAFMKESGRFRMFAKGNLGAGDFNVYRMFVETALTAVRPGGIAAQIAPDNLYSGANAAAIREALFSSFSLKMLVGFENTNGIWFPAIASRAKFCLYVAERGGPTTAFLAAFGVNTLAKLEAVRAGKTLTYPVGRVVEFSPEALAIAEIIHPNDVAIVQRLYARFPNFGADQPGLARRHYMTELHMGNDRKYFGTDPAGVPLYEGRMVDTFDHRAKAYVSGRARSGVWRILPFGALDKAIVPQWRISMRDIPNRIGNRWKTFRIGFCDAVGPSNSRTLVAALIPVGVLCGHKVPTITFEPDDPRLSMLWLGVANAFCIDYLARKKVSLTMSYTLMDSLPLPRAYDGTALEEAIAVRALRLSATGIEMHNFWINTAPLLGLDPERESPCEAPAERARLRAELDVLVARDVFRITRDEMRYLLDPADSLGQECGFETFGALKRAEQRQYGEFRTRRLILDAWDGLPSPIEGAKATAAAS